MELFAYISVLLDIQRIPLTIYVYKDVQLVYIIYLILESVFSVIQPVKLVMDLVQDNA